MKIDRFAFRALGIFFVAALSASCVSKSQAPVVNAGDTTQAANGAVLSPGQALPKKYEHRSSLDERFQVMSPALKRDDSGSSSSSSSSGAAATNTGVSGTGVKSSSLEENLGRSIYSLLHSERWPELLEESSAAWKKCSQNEDVRTSQCVALAQVRAIAFARMGYLREALSLYEKLSSTQLTSTNALLFAGLLVDSGSPRLCAQLAKSGLQWEPSEPKVELYALQAKCLRLDGQSSESRSSLTRGLAEFPENPSLLLESALLHLSEKNLTQGCDLLERLYLREIKDIAVSFNWGTCLVGRRDADGARRVLDKARREWPSERLWILLSGEVSYLEGNMIGARRDGLDYLASVTAGDEFRIQAERLIRNAQGE